MEQLCLNGNKFVLIQQNNLSEWTKSVSMEKACLYDGRSLSQWNKSVSMETSLCQTCFIDRLVSLRLVPLRQTCAIETDLFL